MSALVVARIDGLAAHLTNALVSLPNCSAQFRPIRFRRQSTFAFYLFEASKKFIVRDDTVRIVVHHLESKVGKPGFTTALVHVWVLTRI